MLHWSRCECMSDLPSALRMLVLSLASPSQDPMDVDDLTPLMKQLVDLIRPKAEDVPDAVRYTHQQQQQQQQDDEPCSLD